MFSGIICPNTTNIIPNPFAISKDEYLAFATTTFVPLLFNISNIDYL